MNDERDIFGGAGSEGFRGHSDSGPVVPAHDQGMLSTNSSPLVPKDKQMKLAGISRIVAAYELHLSHTDTHVGHSPDNDVSVEERSVSDFHARIHFDGTDYILEDQGSEHGTRVNSERFRRFVLHYNDMVQFGDVRFRFVKPQDAVIPEAGSVSLYVRREPKFTAKARKKAIAGGAVGAVIVLALAAWLIIRSVAPSWVPGLGSSGPSAVEAMTIEQRLQAARRLFEAEKYEEARLEFDRVKELAATMPGGLDAQAANYLDRIQRETLARDRYSAVLALRKVGKAADAYALLAETLPQLAQDTRSYAKLKALEPALKGEAVGGLLSSAKEALDAGKRKEARALAKQALALDPRNELAARYARSQAGGPRLASNVDFEEDEGEYAALTVADRQRRGGIDFAYDTGLVDVKNKTAAGATRGRLAQKEIERVVAQHAAEIRWCYKQALAAQPGLVGKVETQWTVAPNGRVKGARITHSSLGNAEAETCITRKVGRWSFPAPSGGEVVVNYPFSFEPKAR